VRLSVVDAVVRGRHKAPRVSSHSIKQHTAYIGLGANLGDAQQTIEQAFVALASIERCHLIAQSKPIVTKPWEATGPDFVNAVASLRTALAPEALLQAILDIELKFGRDRSYKNAPRTLDLDLLLYDDLVYLSDRLQLPHPRMHQRAFVLAPLIEIAPDIAIPSHGKASDCLAKI
jgi:2-amino-4-hydroxy-6-hydroxymethyldihydropteridine diphosphokinase